MEPGDQPKPDKKDVLPPSQESWAGLESATKEFLDQALVDSGMSRLQAQESICVKFPESDRVPQVNMAMEAALGILTARQIESTQKLQSLPIGTLTISIENGNALILVRQKNSEDDEYAQARKNLLEKTNEILQTFGKSPLPPYISQNREQI